MSDISVIIPTYNRGYIIKKSIESVLSQDYEDFELIIVDDGSTDDTESVISVIKDDRIVYHRLDENGGAAHARNEGIKLAKNKIIAFQDSDDMWHKDKLTDVTYSELGVSYSLANHYDSRCRIISKYFNDIQAFGMTDAIIADLFARAENAGILDSVKKMLMLYLSKK